MLSHKHPEDYEHIAATLDDIRRTRKPFSTPRRIIIVQGETRDVVVIGERFYDDTGEVIDTQGFYINVPVTHEIRPTITHRAPSHPRHRNFQDAR